MATTIRRLPNFGVSKEYISQVAMLPQGSMNTKPVAQKSQTSDEASVLLNKMPSEITFLDLGRRCGVGPYEVLVIMNFEGKTFRVSVATMKYRIDNQEEHTSASDTPTRLSPDSSNLRH
ncbi:MAG: hypothetical protein R3C68_02870 [Myxococcota bacterium]